MPRHRTHEVRQKNRKNPLHCGTITKEDFLVMDRAQRRKEQIESGIPTNQGCGVQGGDKRQQSRRDRQSSRQAIRNRDWD